MLVKKNGGGIADMLEMFPVIPLRNLGTCTLDGRVKNWVEKSDERRRRKIAGFALNSVLCRRNLTR